MPKPQVRLDPQLAAEAKAIVALAFRNGPIEDVHAGKECPNCAGKVEYSHITQAEMKHMMKRAVDTVYKLLWLKQNDPEKYAATGLGHPTLGLAPPAAEGRSHEDSRNDRQHSFSAFVHCEA